MDAVSTNTFAPREPIGPVMQRIALLDVLRGLAILGILLFNIQAFSGYGFLSSQQAATLPASSADTALRYAMAALIEGKFYSLFSLLFGVGFAVFLKRAGERGTSPVGVLLRRYFGLLGIGLIHSVLIWFGDILVLYALLGVLLLAFRHQSNRTLLGWAVALLSLPILLYGLGLTLLPAGPHSGGVPPALVRALGAFRSGGYVDIVSGNIAFGTFGWLRRLVLMFYPRVFGTFLLGFVLGRMGVFQSPARHARLLLDLSRSGLLIGLMSGILYAAFDRGDALLPLSFNGFVRTIFESISAPLLSLGYAAWITLAFQRPRWQPYLLWFAPVGRMALSNYLFQSVTGVILFYGIGGALFMRVSLATALSIAMLIFMVQAALSGLYLSRFAHGPAEWAWRRITYAKRVPLKRATAAAAV